MLKKLVFISVLLTTFIGINAYAQGTAPFGVTGAISPSSCILILSNGTVNLGSLTLTAVRGYGLINNNGYKMAPQTATVSISCSVPTKFSLSFIDNKSVTTPTVIDGNDSGRFVLGDTATGPRAANAVGSYQVAFTSTTMDVGGGVTPAPVGQFLSAPIGSQSWITGLPGGLTLSAGTVLPGKALAFAKTAGVTTPDSILKLDGTLTFTTHLGKTVIDSATTIVTPSGSGTMTLFYL